MEVMFAKDVVDDGSFAIRNVMSKFDKVESNLQDLDELRTLFVCNFATILPISRLIILCGGESGHVKDLLQGSVCRGVSGTKFGNTTQTRSENNIER
jgi:hypothetical protein